MRARDIRIGHTYVVLVPHRLPAARYPDRERPGTSMWMAGLMTGARFRLTVTSVDPTAEPATAQGIRLIERAHAAIMLTDDQAAAIGLAPEQGYCGVGSLIDHNGLPARVPSLETIRIPVRWLHTIDDPHLQRCTHRDADHWPYM
ncbi:hypothetical protein [Nocardia sp. AB354]|uniref:hypothetical protein n=1 Tax=Nocardia sp. AB354 TaxID=3413283 RepID=UPI003C20966E